MSLGLIFLFAAVGVLFATFTSMVKIVPQSEQWTLERFGRFTHVLKPGLNIIIPFADRVSVRINMRECVLDVPQQDVITKDNAMVRVDGVVFYRIFDSVKAAYEVNDLEEAISNLTLTNIRTVMGAMTLDQLLSNREAINATLLSVIDEATDPWGVKVNRIEIKDITPPHDLVQSMARQMKAERDKRATILDAEAVREAAILAAEGNQKALILEAEGKKKALILASEAEKEQSFREAEARERRGQAEAKATEMVSKAINEGSIHAINYFVAQQYVASLKEIGHDGKVIFMPMESSSVLSSLGGIAELTKEAFAKAQK